MTGCWRRRSASSEGLLRDVAFSRLVMWLPTYRRSVRGDLRHEGTVDAQEPGGIKRFDPDRFDALLQEHDAVCVIKLHPMADRVDYPVGSDRVLVWTEGEVEADGATTYSLLARADVLVSDISSVWVDYLLLNRPIVFAFGDEDVYAHDRGYTLEPLSDWLPGPIVQDMDQFMQALQIALETPASAEQERVRITRRLHRFSDADSARRVIDAIEGLGTAATRKDQQSRAAGPAGTGHRSSPPHRPHTVA